MLKNTLQGAISSSELCKFIMMKEKGKALNMIDNLLKKDKLAIHIGEGNFTHIIVFIIICRHGEKSPIFN
mgnify:CR=1 FL=1